MWQFYFKQKVEIATLPSVARDDVVIHRDWAATKQMQ
jgi:hypothetical protein